MIENCNMYEGKMEGGGGGMRERWYTRKRNLAAEKNEAVKEGKME